MAKKRSSSTSTEGYRISETICAIATPHGVGGIAIVRLSGEKALEIAKKIAKKEQLLPRHASLCSLYDFENSFIDQAIVLYFQAPKSFTGEEVIEFQGHGGFITASRILDSAIAYGARLAEPGEFTKRAVLHGKMDLSQAEATAKLIASKSIDAAKILSRQLKGDLQRYVDTLREQLVEILAYVEVNIDYAEEDLPQTLQNDIQKRLEQSLEKLSKTLQISQSREGLLEGFRIAIIGKPNVGKSSLLNALLSFERAIISDIAGTTRDTIEEEIKIGTHLVKIVDTAGIRQSGDAIEKIGIERSIEAIERADIVIALFDASRSLDSDDANILALLEQYQEQKEFIVALNKSDLLQKIEKEVFAKFDYLEISAKQSPQKILEALKALLDTKAIGENDTILISKRQINAAQKAFDAIMRASEVLDSGELELFAYELNEAIDAIASITQAFERDEILDKMFSSFCLGK